MTGSDVLSPLARIMVAPNGARRMKTDHPALPVTIEETVAAARACYEAGADAIHAHVRDENGAHVLDASLYRELLTRLQAEVPHMRAQITTEAVGKYSPEEQRAVVRDVMPEAVSVAVREMCPDSETAEARAFYHWAREALIVVQHIVYTPDDFRRFLDLVADGTIPGKAHQVLFVLGRYAENQESAPEDLDPYLAVLEDASGELHLDWAICAFGHRETECLARAIERGGKARIGFENGLWNRDGRLAADNADRVRDLISVVGPGA
jgi:3-keto-5-aminohexanoate cleavage enzyme